MQPDKIMAYVDRLKDTKLACGKTLLELTTYKNICLWWFADVAFYYYLFNREYSISDGDIRSYQRVKTNKWVNALIRRIYYISDYFLATIAHLMLIRSGRMKRVRSLGSENNVILITGADIEWRKFYISGQVKPILSNQFFHAIIHELSKSGNCNIVSTYPLKFPYISSIRTVISKYKHWDVLHIPLNYFFNLRIGKDRREAKRHFRRVWGLLKDDQVLTCLLKHPEDPDRNVREKFKNYFAYDRPEYVFAEFDKFISMAEAMLEHVKPAVIVIENEYSVFERALIAAGKKRGIPCIAIQHGVIHELHKGYMYQAGEISPNCVGKAPFVPIADVTAVYGQYHKDLLTEVGGYPEDAVVVTGQPRYDRIAELGRESVRTKLTEEWHLNSSKRIILWTTQCHGISDSENELNFRTVFDSVASIEDVQLVIKQHPGEPKRYDAMIREYLKKYSIDAQIVPKDADTLGLIAISDLVLLLSSTTGFEAAALQKPIIVMNLSDRPDIVSYVQEGVACGVYRPEELRPSINHLLCDDSYLARNRRKFIQKYLHKVDGKAAERVVTLIERHMESGGSGTARQPRH